MSDIVKTETGIVISNFVVNMFFCFSGTTVSFSVTAMPEYDKFIEEVLFCISFCRFYRIDWFAVRMNN